MERDDARRGHPRCLGWKAGIPSLDFDMVGFTLQYELSPITAILNMLDLAGIPLRTSQRTSLAPMIIAGGPCACNPEPLADFIDLFVLGEGEEVNLELAHLSLQAKKEGWSREAVSAPLPAQIEGVYVPSLYEVSYQEDGTIRGSNAPRTARRRWYISGL